MSLEEISNSSTCIYRRSIIPIQSALKLFVKTMYTLTLYRERLNKKD